MRARSRFVAPLKAMSVVAAASVASLCIAAAGALPASAATSPALEGGAVGIFANKLLGLPLNVAEPAVVTPPNGGSQDATLGAISLGGMPPLVPPLIALGVSAVHTDGTLTKGGVTNSPLVNSSAKIAFLSVPLLGIDLHLVKSTCTADDPPSGKPTVTASTTLAGHIGTTQLSGNQAPNQTIHLGLVTIVINEQVRGQSSDGHPGILVNAVHIYSSAPGPTYSNQGLILDESRCEVAPIPIPPGIVPETPFAAALPITAAVVGGLGLVVLRLRRRRHQMV